MTYKPLTALLSALLMVGLLAEPPRPPVRHSDGPILPRIELLKVAGTAYRTLIADYYWLLTIQQVGRSQTAAEYRDVYFYAAHATSLDPKFYSVYPFAAIGVTHNLGRETWVNTDESTKLVRNGLEAFPESVQLRFLLAHNLMYYAKDYGEAARIIQELAEEPNAPDYLAALATRLLAHGGDFDAGLDLAVAMRDSAPDDETREFYENRILEIHLEKRLQEVDRAADSFRDARGVMPTSIEQLVSDGLLSRVPEDPLGGKIHLDEDGRAQSTSMTKRLRLLHQNPQWIDDA